MKNTINMLAIDKNDYVDYDIGASLPSGLTYVEGQGLIVFGQGTGTLKKRVVINPDALKSTATEVNLFDAEKGELNPDLYEQMALPDGMTYNKNDGLVLTGSGDNAKSLTINPNYVPKNINLFDVETKKIDTSLSTLPTGLSYSRSTGLEIGGDTLLKSLVIDPNGFTQKTNLFETNQNKINEDLYIQGGDSRLPDWVNFEDTDHTIVIEGFPEEGVVVPPKLFLNGGAIKKNVYIISTDTGFLKAELPTGMTFDQSTGLKLENNSGGSIRIPVGDTKLTREVFLFDYTNFNPVDPSKPLQNYYPAINIPTYINNGDEVYLGISGLYFNESSSASSYITTIGGKELILKKIVSGVTTNLINVTDDGVDPSTIKSGIDASKITTGTLTNIPIISNKPIEIENDVITLSNKNGIKYNGTGSIFQIQSNGDIQHLIKESSRGLEINSRYGITYTASDSIFNLDTSGTITFDFKDLRNRITIDDEDGFKYINKDKGNALFQIDPNINFYYHSQPTLEDKHQLLFSPSEGIQYTGGKSVFNVYPSGNVRVSHQDDSSSYTQIIANALECVYKNKVYVRSTSLGTDQESNLASYLQHTWITNCNNKLPMRFWNDDFKAETTSDCPFINNPLNP